MTFIQTLLALICVVTISAGQLLFKRAGLEIQGAGGWLNWRVFFIVGVAGVIYGLATLLWINLLRDVALNKAYLFMALSFVFVPVASHFIFHEPLTTGFLIGGAIVVVGLFIATRFG